MKISKKNPLLGAHMSIAGGLQNALTAGESIDCTAIQIFTANNRQWSLKAIAEQEVKIFLEYKKKSSIQALMSHASYLINLGSPKKDIAEKSKKALQAELLRCEQLQIPYTIIHPGACLDSNEHKCLEQIAHNISLVLTENPGACMVLLENTAGQGSNVGYSFEQLAQIRSMITENQRVGICFDTCHACAAGYTFNTADSYKKLWDTFDQLIGIEHLKAIHLNDSRKECGSRVDRHEHIGQGKIGIEAFRLIMNDSRFINIPKILETPKEKDLKEDVINLKKLRSLLPS